MAPPCWRIRSTTASSVDSSKMIMSSYARTADITSLRTRVLRMRQGDAATGAPEPGAGPSPGWARFWTSSTGWPVRDPERIEDPGGDALIAILPRRCDIGRRAPARPAPDAQGGGALVEGSTE